MEKQMKRVGNYYVQDDDSFFQFQYDRGFPMDGSLHSKIVESVPNGNDGFDIRPIHNVEKLIGYCTKQIKTEEQSYEVIDYDCQGDCDPTCLAC